MEEVYKEEIELSMMSGDLDLSGITETSLVEDEERRIDYKDK